MVACHLVRFCLWQLWVCLIVSGGGKGSCVASQSTQEASGCYQATSDSRLFDTGSEAQVYVLSCGVEVENTSHVASHTRAQTLSSTARRYDLVLQTMRNSKQRRAIVLQTMSPVVGEGLDPAEATPQCLQEGEENQRKDIQEGPQGREIWRETNGSLGRNRELPGGPALGSHDAPVPIVETRARSGNHSRATLYHAAFTNPQRAPGQDDSDCRVGATIRRGGSDIAALERIERHRLCATGRNGGHHASARATDGEFSYHFSFPYQSSQQIEGTSSHAAEEAQWTGQGMVCLHPRHPAPDSTACGYVPATSTGVTGILHSQEQRASGTQEHHLGSFPQFMSDCSDSTSQVRDGGHHRTADGAPTDGPDGSANGYQFAGRRHGQPEEEVEEIEDEEDAATGQKAVEPRPPRFRKATSPSKVANQHLKPEKGARATSSTVGARHK